MPSVGTKSASQREHVRPATVEDLDSFNHALYDVERVQLVLSLADDIASHSPADCRRREMLMVTAVDVLAPALQKLRSAKRALTALLQPRDE